MYRLPRCAQPSPSKTMAPPPSPRTETRPIEVFKAALEDLADGMVVMSESQSLVAMFDDLETHWVGIRNRLHDTEDKMYTLACHFQNLQLGFQIEDLSSIPDWPMGRRDSMKFSKMDLH